MPPDVTEHAEVDGRFVKLPWEDVRDLGMYIAGVEARADLTDVCVADRVHQFGELNQVTYAPDGEASLVWLSGADLVIYWTLRPGVNVTVQWKTCGGLNSYYLEDTQQIVLCYEILNKGFAFTRFVAAHEATHANIIQKDVPFTGSHEAAADEYATLILLSHGYVEDVVSAADVFMEIGGVECPGCDHPSNQRRAHSAVQLAMGFKGNPFFAYKWQRAKKAWNTLLGGL